MGLNQTPSAERVHIGIFGKMNAGKSSIINAITAQNLSIVSDIPGTTTDPVLKSMELLPIGPVVLMDTPGLDDQTELGKQRIEKTQDVLKKSDLALIVVDATIGVSHEDESIIMEIEKREIPYILVFNKSDLSITQQEGLNRWKKKIFVSAETGLNIKELKDLMGSLSHSSQQSKKILMDVLNEGDLVILVVPIDSAAPKGRIILPQQQVLREVLDHHGKCLVVQPEELESTLELLNAPPAIVVTDSQVFDYVKQVVPSEIYLTSFSILFARYKGDLKEVIKGAGLLSQLKEKTTPGILISEGCTHHRQCDDIGTVKLPKWIKSYMNNDNIEFQFTSGGGFIKDFNNIDLVVHCGGCMLNAKEMGRRMNETISKEIPITNYGILIAHMNGILERSIEIFVDKNKL